MKKRIFHNTLILLLVSSLLSISISFVFYSVIKSQKIETIKDVLPVVVVIMVLILIIAYVIARRFADYIVKPLSDIDLENNNIAAIKAIADNMKEGLILVDIHGVILSANMSAMEIFKEDDMLNKSIFHTCKDMDLLQKIKLCLSGNNYEILYESNNKKYNTYLNPVYNGTQIKGAVILFLDTTESNYAEKQRKEFSANVSHELKTPLTTISALSEMIVNGMVKEKDVTGFVHKISDQTNRLINIVDDIVKLSEFDEGNIRSEFSSFDLYDLTDSVVSSLQDKADRKNVKVEILGEHLQIMANERMIDELLFNLIDNGIKYNKEGGKVSVSLSKDKDFYKISVADTGIGIPKEDHSRVFERFYRVDKSRSKKIGGTGLGLSIVKHIVEYHKGKIEMESNENIGTRITCYLVQV